MRMFKGKHAKWVKVQLTQQESADLARLSADDDRPEISQGLNL